MESRFFTERRRPSVTPITPISTIELIFMENEIAVARGEARYEDVVRNLASVALNEIYTLAIADPDVWKEFQQHLEKALEIRYRRLIPPIKFEGKTEFLDEIRHHISRYIGNIIDPRTIRGGQSELERIIDNIVYELIVIAAKSFFRYYGLMRWIIRG